MMSPEEIRAQALAWSVELYGDKHVSPQALVHAARTFADYVGGGMVPESGDVCGEKTDAADVQQVGGAT